MAATQPKPPILPATSKLSWAQVAKCVSAAAQFYVCSIADGTVPAYADHKRKLLQHHLSYQRPHRQLSLLHSSRLSHLHHSRLSMATQNQYQRAGRIRQPSSHLNGTMSLNFKPKFSITPLQILGFRLSFSQRWSQNQYHNQRNLLLLYQNLSMYLSSQLFQLKSKSKMGPLDLSRLFLFPPDPRFVRSTRVPIRPLLCLRLPVLRLDSACSLEV